jgi:hypothetical protein
MDFLSLINSRDEASSQLQKLRKKIEAVKKEHSDLIENRKKEIEKLKKKIDFNFLSISIEKSLISLPHTALGSKEFSLRLNQKASLFDNTQFNKLVRFLSFIENSEDQYNSSYHSIKKSYLTSPDKTIMSELIGLNRVINYEYSLMHLLCECVDKSKVEFNKIYNAIEDRGIFQTASEKFQNNMLLKISGSLQDIAHRIDLTNDYLKDISFQLWSIDDNITSSAREITSQLGSLESAVQAGNALSAVQSYQLYSMNRNIKKLHN